MTKNEKDLLLIDLSARLPYGVHVEISWEYSKADVHTSLEYYEFPNIDSLLNIFWDEKCISIKPYLRSMSSMSEKEKEIITNISNKGKGFVEDEDGWIRCDSIHTKWGVWPDGCANLLDYLNSIHIDYRGLIPMGLALEAPEDMYK